MQLACRHFEIVTHYKTKVCFTAPVCFNPACNTKALLIQNTVVPCCVKIYMDRDFVTTATLKTYSEAKLVDEALKNGLPVGDGISVVLREPRFANRIP